MRIMAVPTTLFSILVVLAGSSMQDCPECACCVNGRHHCDSNKHCTDGCIDGFYGDKCTRDCPKNCKTCNSRYSCHECKQGFYTEQCDTACGKGCFNNTCLLQSGQCTCISNYFQKGKCADCSDNMYGDECNYTCPSNCGTCSSENDCLWCKDTLYYGSNCQHRCSHGCYLGQCNKRNGHCITGCKQGYIGYTCDSCSNGFYGGFCNLSCAEHCSICFSESNCTKCKKGFYGVMCMKSCPSGCKENCSLADGRCLECKQGFNGEFCNITCVNRRYGYNCSRLCKDIDINCRTCFANKSGHYGGCSICNSGYYPVSSLEENHSMCKSCPTTCRGNKCDNTSGLCFLGCKAGFHGSRCDHNCSSRCVNKACNHTTGECLHGCIKSYEGVKCVQVNIETGPENKLTLNVASSAGGIITFIILVALLTVCIIKRKRQQRLHSIKNCEESDYKQGMQNVRKQNDETESEITYAQPFKPKREGEDGTNKGYSTAHGNEKRISDTNNDYALINKGKCVREKTESNEDIYDTTHNKNKRPLDSNNEYAVLSLKSNKLVSIYKSKETQFEDDHDVYDTSQMNKIKDIVHLDNNNALLNCNKGVMPETSKTGPLYNTTRKEMHQVNNDYDVLSIDSK